METFEPSVKIVRCIVNRIIDLLNRDGYLLYFKKRKEYPVWCLCGNRVAQGKSVRSYLSRRVLSIHKKQAFQLNKPKLLLPWA